MQLETDVVQLVQSEFDDFVLFDWGQFHMTDPWLGFEAA
jgi:hypothetical protein